MRYYMTMIAILLALIAFVPVQTLAKGPGSGGGGGGGGSGKSSSGGSNSDNRSSGIHINSGAKSGDHQTSGNTGGNINTGPRINLDKGMKSGKSIGDGMNMPKTFDANNRFDADHRPEFTGGHGEGRENSRYRWDNGRWWFWGPGNQWMWYGDGRWQNYGNAYAVRRPILENFSGGPIKIVNPLKNGVTLSYMLDNNAYTIPPGFSQDLQADRAWMIQFSRGENMDQARYGLQSGLYTFTRTDHGWELYRSEFPQTTAPLAAPENPQ